MVQTAAGEIEKAMGDRLVPGGTLDSVLQNLGVTGVFDHRAVLQNQSFDYIVIGDAIEIPDNTFGRRGYINSITVNVWSRALGSKPAVAIVKRLNELFDQQSIPLSTQAHVSTRYDQSMYVPQRDGLTLLAPVRYMIYSEE